MPKNVQLTVGKTYTINTEEGPITATVVKLDPLNREAHIDFDFSSGPQREIVNLFGFAELLRVQGGK